MRAPENGRENETRSAEESENKQACHPRGLPRRVCDPRVITQLHDIIGEYTMKEKTPGCAKRGCRTPRLISIRLLAVVMLAVILSPVVRPTYQFLKTVLAWEKVERATLSVLKSEDLVFLVTDKVVSQMAVEITDGSPLLGKREGILIGTVTMYYGVDLQKLDESCLFREGVKVVVVLPDPQELDFAVDPASFKYITKRSGLNVIADFLLDKDMEAELRRGLHDHATMFMKEHRLVPTRQKIVKQLNELAVPVFQNAGVLVEFR